MSEWSSFKIQKSQFDGWRSFLAEQKEFYAAGIDSVEMEDSLVNFLKKIKELTPQQIDTIIIFLKEKAKEENVLLEVELGDPGGPNKTFSTQTTKELMSLIAKLDNPAPTPATINKVIRTINTWAKTNQVKFDRPPAPASKPAPAATPAATPADKAEPETGPTAPAADKATEPEKEESLDKDAILRDLRGRMNSPFSVKTAGGRARPTKMKSVPEKLRDVILQSVEKKLDAGENKISISDIFKDLGSKVKLTDDETKIAGTVGKEGLEKAGDTQLERLSKALEEAGISIVDDGQDIDSESLSVIQALSAGRDVRAELEVGTTNRTIARQSVQAKGEEIKVAGATPRANKAKAREEIVDKLRASNSEDDIRAALDLPEDKSIDEYLREIERKRGTKTIRNAVVNARLRLKAAAAPPEVPANPVTVVKTQRDSPKADVRVSKTATRSVVKRLADKPVVSKEEEAFLDRATVPAADLSPEQENNLQQKMERRPKDVEIVMDEFTFDTAIKRLRQIYKPPGDDSEEAKKEFEDEVKKVISFYQETGSRTKTIDKALEILGKKYGAVNMNSVMNIITKATKIEKDDSAPGLAGLASRLASLRRELEMGRLGTSDNDDSTEDDDRQEIPALEPGRRSVQDYINESHEDKFNKLLKAFTK